MRGKRKHFKGFDRLKAIGLAAAFLLPAVFMRQACFALSVRVCDDVYDPLTLDPHKQFSEKNHTLLQQIYEGLVRFTPAGEIEPALAVSWERLSPEKMRFHLRGKAAFHNGEPFSSEAVVYTIKRYLSPSTGFPAAGFIDSIKDAVAVDAQTVDIITKYPDGLLLNRLAAFILIVPPDYGEDVLDGTAKPNGTGPFRFERWEKGRQIVLSANPAYWMPGVPRIDELIFMFIGSDRQVSMLTEGKVDLLTDLPGTQTYQIAASKNTVLLKHPELYTYVSSMDISTGPLSDKNFRMAINYAVDKNQLIRYDAMGNGIALGALAMPGETGYSRSLMPYPYDIDRARKLIVKSGHMNTRFKVFVKMQAERTAKIIAAQLERIGVFLDLHMVPDALMQAELKNQKWDIIIGNCPDPMVHSFFVQAIVLSSQSPFSVMRNAEYDDLLGDFVASIDPDEQQRKGEILQRYIHDNALGIFTYQRIRTYAMRRGVKFIPYITGMPYFYLSEAESENKKPHSH